MLDDSFPTYRMHSSAEDALQTTLFYTYNGSDPLRAYTLQRPAPASSANQYAIALFDAHYQSVIYGEVLVKPEFQQPTLSAAEIRNQNGTPPNVPITPDSFSVLLYNPDQSIVVKRHVGGWNRADSWGFEIPERTFKLPSVSKLDQETGSNDVSDLSPKIMFHWKRDGRLNRDMTCYMSGKSVGGKKSKEPDITVAMYRSHKQGDAVCIYEPNMARVEVEDRKGLEVVLLLSAVVVRDLYMTTPKQDPFNISGAVPAGRRGSRPLAPSPNDPTLVSGALADTTPSPGPAHTPPARPSPASNAAKQAEIDAETRRLQAMVAEEERQRRARLARDEEEKTRRMLQQEEEAQRRRKQAEIDAETERLRREYGVPPPRPTQASPPLPQRPFGAPTSSAAMSGALGGGGGGGWFGPPVVNNLQPPPPPRPNSVGPGPSTQQQQNGRNKLSPYSGPLGARASAISFFGGGKTDEEKRKKMKKKQSVHF